MNGDQYGYYHSQDPSSATDYKNAVIAATIDPHGTFISDWTNLQYLAYGCIGTHFTGSWFDGFVDSYMDQFLGDLSSASFFEPDSGSRGQPPAAQNGGDKDRKLTSLESQNGLSRPILPAESGSRAFQRFHNHARMIPNASSPANANAASLIWPAGIGAACRY